MSATNTLNPTPSSTAALATTIFLAPTPSMTFASSSTLQLTATPTVIPSATINAQVGYIQGHVMIGPLSPVERADEPTRTVPPQVYTSRSINVYRSDSTTLVTSVHLDANGDYRIALAPGTYVVTLAQTGIERAAGLPKTVTIESGKTIQLDVSIDTGIR